MCAIPGVLAVASLDRIWSTLSLKRAAPVTLYVFSVGLLLFSYAGLAFRALRSPADGSSKKTGT